MFLVRYLLAGILLLALAVSASAERVALVVGNSGYTHISELVNPKNDAELIAATLQERGFELIGGGAQLDLDKLQFDRAVRDFGRAAIGADVALFYFAGHGVQLRGSNFLVPVDANPTREADVDFEMVDSRIVLRQMSGAGSKLNLIILDACRNNPFAGRGLRSAAAGLAQMQAPEGTLISFATQPGNVALDGTGGNSPYSRALADAMKRPGLSIFRLFNEVGLAVATDTGGQQQPWVSLSPIKGDFYFNSPDQAEEPQTGALAALQARLKELEDRLTSSGDQQEQQASLPQAVEPQPVEPEAGIAVQPATRSEPGEWRVVGQDTHSLSIESIAVSPDWKLAVTSGNDEKIKIWGIETGRLLRTINGHTDDIDSVDISRDGRHIVSGSDDDTARIWDIATGEELHRFEGDDFRAVRYSPDGKYLALGETQKITLLDAKTYEPVTSFRGHDDYSVVSILRFSRDGTRLASGGADDKVLIWSIPEFRAHATIPVGEDQDDFVFLDNRNKLLVGTEEGLAIWKVGDSYAQAQAEIEYGVDAVGFDGNTGRILTADDVGGLFVHDAELENGREVTDSYKFVLEAGGDRLLKSSSTQLELVDFSDPDNSSLIRSFGYRVEHTHVIIPVLGNPNRVFKTDYDGVIEVDLLSGDITKRYVSGETTDISREILAQSEGGRWILSYWASDYDIWEVDGTYVGEFEDYDSIPDTIDIAPDGSAILAGGYDEGVVRRLSQGSANTLHKGEEDVELLRFTDNGRKILMALEGGKIQIRNASNRAVEKEIDLPGDSYYTYHYDRENSLIYSLDPGTTYDDGLYHHSFHVFDADTLEYLSGTKVSAQEDDAWASSMIPLPSLGKVATGHHDGNIRIWDLSTGRLEHEMRGHGGLVSSIVHPGGNHIVTAADDGMRLWNVAEGRQVARYVFFRDGQSIMIDQEGRFSGTRSAPQYVALARSLENKPLDPATMREKHVEDGLLDSTIFDDAGSGRSLGASMREAVIEQIANRSAEYLALEETERTGDLQTALQGYLELARNGDANALARLLANSGSLSTDAREFADIIGKGLQSGDYRIVLQVKREIAGWSPDLRSAMQNLLKSAGNYDGPIDGIFGPQSLAAIDSYSELD